MRTVLLGGALVACVAAAQAGDALRIEVTEGGGVVVARSAASSRRIAVTVRDESGRPAPNVTVTFRLPAEEPTGDFASGLRSESMLTGAKGDAYVQGIQWHDTPGRVEVRIVASGGGRRGEAAAYVEISPTLEPARAGGASTAVRGASSGRKWLLLALVAGGAGVGLAMGGGGAPAAAGVGAAVAPAALVVPPSLGAPAITIGRP